MEHVLIRSSDVAGNSDKILRRLEVAVDYQRKHSVVLVANESLVRTLYELGADQEFVVALPTECSTELDSFMRLCDMRGRYVTSRTFVYK